MEMFFFCLEGSLGKREDAIYGADERRDSMIFSLWLSLSISFDVFDFSIYSVGT